MSVENCNTIETYESFMYDDDNYEDYGDYPVRSVLWWERDEMKYPDVDENYEFSFIEEDG